MCNIFREKLLPKFRRLVALKTVYRALLIIFFRSGSSLAILSCTDDACSWKKLQKETLENYEPVPLDQHMCFYMQRKRKSR